ncbi:MAG: Gldg family protein [Planctomycetales bacterium]|nr:Gldg family protein [Planctomycetales bacterium]
MTLRPAVIWALFQRNFNAYFSGILGYLFILVFVVTGGVVAFSPTFFAANESNLDQLTEWYSLLLLFFIPAITMGVWAEERKSGTDELLFTLPATDLEILLGKYFSATSVYSVALLFALTHAAVLAYIGEPDPWLLLATYFGYWSAGAALVGLGMLGSILTSNMAVAFVYGVLLCALPVFIGRTGEFLGWSDVMTPFALDEQLRMFSVGLVSLASLTYLLSIVAIALYLNYVLMTRRHWGARQGDLLPVQYATRVISLIVTVACLTAWANYSGAFIDTTTERLYSLAPITRETLSRLESDRPIEIQAFISPEVPQEYVDTRKRLLRLLEQFDRMGGDKLEVRIVETKPFSSESDEAEHLGIIPVRMMGDRDGRPHEMEVYLGATVISSYDKVVIPFFGKALPLEYELTRSIHAVAQQERSTIGVLATDAGMMRGDANWPLIDELSRHYDMKSIPTSADLREQEIDLLIVGMPSSLTDIEMDQLVRYVQSGKPVLIFDDPLPVTLNSNGGQITVAPRLPKPPAAGGQRGQLPELKADGGQGTRLLNALGLEWAYDKIVFDTMNPHPELDYLPAEYVFVLRGGSAGGGFGPDLAATRQLEEMILLYPGAVRATGRGGFTAIDLLRTSPRSGIEPWDVVVEEIEEDPIMAMLAGRQPGQKQYRLRNSVDPAEREIGDENLPLAVRVTGGDAASSVNAIYVADIDMLTSFFVRDRIFGDLPMRFDNVTFVVNAIDTLLGDESFIELRSRREATRRLTAIESRIQTFRVAANEAIRKANTDAAEELGKQEEEFKLRAAEIKEDESLDLVARTQLLEQAEETARQRIDNAKRLIEDEKQGEIQRIRAESRQQIREVETQARFWAVLIGAFPATLLGLVMFIIRFVAERSQVVPHRQRSH